MNDSQSTDYLQTLKQLIQPRKDWHSIPEIINLSFKAISHELEQHLQNFLEHKTLINEQSIKIKQLEIKLQNKLNKKDLESQVLSIINYKSGSARQLEDSLSQYDKLLKQSRYDRDRNFQTVEELKTIAEIITKKREEIIKKDMQDKLLVNKLEIQQQISNLKENIKSRMVEFEKQRREWVNECKQAHSRLEQSALRASHLQAQDKIGLLENSNKRMSDSLNLILNHLQNYTTKEQINAILERQREKQRDRDRKSPQHIKQKDADKSKKKDEEEIVKLVQSSIRKIKNEERKEWIQFKQSVNKEIGTMISIQAVNNIVDNLTKNLQEKYQAFTLNLNKLEQKFISHTKPQQQPKENISKSERRVEKKVSPSKSIESIQSSLARLQKNIVDRQNSQFRRLQEQVETRIQNYDSKLMQELDRREKHLCEVIQQTYNQSAGSRQPANLKQTLRRLNQTNLYAKYLYLGVKQCKKQSCLVWQKETLNNLTDNFVWKKDSNFIFINTPGLYKIEVGLFGVNIPEATLLVNSEPIATLPTPQNRRNTGAKIRGSNSTEFLILPAKVKLSVRVDQNFYGEAFLFLQLL